MKIKVIVKMSLNPVSGANVIIAEFACENLTEVGRTLRAYLGGLNVPEIRPGQIADYYITIRFI